MGLRFRESVPRQVKVVVNAVGVNELSHAQERAEDDRGGRERWVNKVRENVQRARGGRSSRKRISSLSCSGGDLVG